MTTESEFINIGNVADFSEGQVRTFEVAPNQWVGVVRLEGELHAFSNYCTHLHIRLAVDSWGALTAGPEITCWMHGTTYDMRSGASLWGPGQEPLLVYKLRVEREEVFLAVRPEEP
jgi:3-phenylpropionate/trans-cinnamate dioxygenase ferredoxin subunit